MTDAAEQRIAILEAEVRSLKILLGTQQRTLTPPPRPAEPTVRISHPTRRVELPNAEERRRLCEIVWERYPTLRRGRGEEEEMPEGFAEAFLFAQHHGRRAEPDRQRSIGWWVDTARAWVSQNDVGGFPISVSALVVAIIAAGDIAYTNPEEPGFAIGLQFGGGGSPSKDWWRRALAGTLLDPVPPSYPRAVASPARARRP
jgi:hypothetical protein